jgi:hypothetical protein
VKYFISVLITITFFILSSGCSSHKSSVKPVEVVVDTNDTNISDKIEREQLIHNPYIPTLEVLPDQVKLVSTTKELQKAIDEAKEGDTIFVEDGKYEGVYIIDKKRLTIRAKNNLKAVFSSKNPEVDSSAFKLKNSSYINIVGFEGVNSRYFVFAPSWNSEVDHIYIADCLIHNMRNGIYSGINSHDWTVDRCKFDNISPSSAWSSHGYHHTLQNSYLNSINNFTINIRGYAPIGEINKNDYPKYDNPPIKDRNPNSYHRLNSKNWTHYIRNNIFSKNVSNKVSRSCNAKSVGKDFSIGFYFGGKNSVDADKYHLSPQNVLIENNIFYTKHDYSTIFADKGFGYDINNTKHGLPILGTILKDNITDAKHILSENRLKDLSMFKLINNRADVNSSEILNLIKNR